MSGELIDVLVCYAAQDEEYATQLVLHFAPLEFVQIVRVRRRVLSGNWLSNIGGVSCLLLLLSSDFLAAAQQDGALKRIVELQDARRIAVIPVLVRPCAWESTSLARLKPLPSDANPVTKWQDKDEAHLDIVKGLIDLIPTISAVLPEGSVQDRTQPYIPKAWSLEEIKYFAEELREFSDAARRIAIEKPIAWEGLLFSQALADEIRSSSPLKRELMLGVYYGPLTFLGPKETAGEFSQHFASATRLSSNMSHLVNVAFREAMGPPGVEADPVMLAHTAKRLGDGYRQAIEWALRWRKYHVHREYQRLISLGEAFTMNMIREIEAWSAALQRDIPAYVAEIAAGRSPGPFTTTLTLTAPDAAPIVEETERLALFFAKNGEDSSASGDDP